MDNRPTSRESDVSSDYGNSVDRRWYDHDPHNRRHARVMNKRRRGLCRFFTCMTLTAAIVAGGIFLPLGGTGVSPSADTAYAAGGWYGSSSKELVESIQLKKNNLTLFGSTRYMTFRINGETYDSRYLGPDANFRVWQLCNDEKKRELCEFFYSPHMRQVNFGKNNAQIMANWIKERQEWRNQFVKIHRNIETKYAKELYDYYSDDRFVINGEGGTGLTHYDYYYKYFLLAGETSHGSDICNSTSELADEYKNRLEQNSIFMKAGKQAYDSLIMIREFAYDASTKAVLGWTLNEVVNLPLYFVQIHTTAGGSYSLCWEMISRGTSYTDTTLEELGIGVATNPVSLIYSALGLEGGVSPKNARDIVKIVNRHSEGYYAVAKFCLDKTKSNAEWLKQNEERIWEEIRKEQEEKDSAETKEVNDRIQEVRDYRYATESLTITTGDVYKELDRLKWDMNERLKDFNRADAEDRDQAWDAYVKARDAYENRVDSYDKSIRESYASWEKEVKEETGRLKDTFWSSFLSDLYDDRLHANPYKPGTYSEDGIPDDALEEELSRMDLSTEWRRQLITALDTYLSDTKEAVARYQPAWGKLYYEAEQVTAIAEGNLVTDVGKGESVLTALASADGKTSMYRKGLEEDIARTEKDKESLKAAQRYFREELKERIDIYRGVGMTYTRTADDFWTAYEQMTELCEGLPSWVKAQEEFGYKGSGKLSWINADLRERAGNLYTNSNCRAVLASSIKESYDRCLALEERMKSDADLMAGLRETRETLGRQFRYDDGNTEITGANYLRGFGFTKEAADYHDLFSDNTAGRDKKSWDESDIAALKLLYRDLVENGDAAMVYRLGCAELKAKAGNIRRDLKAGNTESYEEAASQVLQGDPGDLGNNYKYSTVYPRILVDKEKGFIDDLRAIAEAPEDYVPVAGLSKGGASAGANQAVFSMEVKGDAAPDLSLSVGESGTLTAVTVPADATIKKIHWISEDPEVATVDEKGRVTALSYGTAVIRAQAEDAPVTEVTDAQGNLTYLADSSCEVSFTVRVQGLSYEIYEDSGSGSGNTDAETISCARITGYEGTGATLSIPMELDGYPVTEIGAFAFRGNVSITSAVLPETLETIGKEAFSGCTGITGLILDSGLKVVEENAFSGCTGLREVWIPAGLTKLSGGAFAGCLSLQKIYYEGDTQEWEALISGYGKTEGDVLSRAEVCFVSGGRTEEIPVEFVGTDVGELTLTEGESESVSAYVIPEYASVGAYVWQSSDTAVATVSDTGLITAVGPGEAGITVSTGGKTAGITVHVKKAPVPGERIYLTDEEGNTVSEDPDSTPLSVELGNSVRLIPHIVPENAEDQRIRWRTEDSAIATVTDGVVSCNGEVGGTNIYAETAEGLSACAQIRVSSRVRDVVLTPASLTVPVGESRTVKVESLPAGADSDSVWTHWDTKDKNIASADWDFDLDVLRITGLKTGSTVVQVSYGGITSDCRVTVVKAGGKTVPVTGVTLSRKSLELKPGGSAALTVSLTPANPSNAAVEFASSNPDTVSVDAKGNLVARRIGKSVITVSVHSDGQTPEGVTLTETCEVRVKKDVSGDDDNGENGNSETGEDEERDPFYEKSREKAADTFVAGQKVDMAALYFSDYLAALPAGTKVKYRIVKESNTAKASVSAKGIVTGKTAGSAAVILRIKSGNQFADAPGQEKTIHFLGKPKLKFSKVMTYARQKRSGYQYMTGGEDLALKADSWSSSDEKVARVDPSTGLITAGEKDGSTKITAFFGDPSEKGCLKITAVLKKKTPAFAKKSYRVLTGSTVSLSLKNLQSGTPVKWSVDQSGGAAVLTGGTGKQSAKAVLKAVSTPKGMITVCAEVDGQSLRVPVEIPSPELKSSTVTVKAGSSAAPAVKNTKLKAGTDYQWSFSSDTDPSLAELNEKTGRVKIKKTTPSGSVIRINAVVGGISLIYSITTR